MPSSAYVSLSAQVTLDRRLTTIANNVANLNTPGFRAEGVKFETILSRAGSEEVTFPTMGETYLKRQSGPISRTGNPLDVAVQGDGWLGIATPAGVVYTRDGRMHVNEGGELLSVAGYPVLDPGGGAIVVDPTGGEVTIAEDGAISQGGKQVSAIGLYLIPQNATLTRYENSGVIPDQPAEPVEDTTSNSVRQGYLEGANVNPIEEMAKLVMLSRTFDSAASAMEQVEGTEQQAIRTLAPGS